MSSVITGTRTSTTILEEEEEYPKSIRLSFATRVSNAIPICWELARFHTRESWLECFPAVWGLCLSAGKNNIFLSPRELIYTVAATWLSMTLLHGTFCTINDIVDAAIDRDVPRTKSRPIPSGRITRSGAFISFCVMCTATIVVTALTLGKLALLVSLPIYVIAGVYPFMKRLVQWPQFILAPAVAWPAFVGWVAVAGNTDTIWDCVPLFGSVCIWTIYFDTCYGIQDAKYDKKIGVGSLAVFLGDRVKIFLGIFGFLLIALLSLNATNCNSSLFFWVFGIGVWSASIPYQLSILNLRDGKTGGRVFGINISLGLYITVVSFLEMGWNRTSAV